jgi:hypothetical protein
MGKLKKYFRRLRDPRAANASYPLLEILFVALAAVLCGATGGTDMSDFGRRKIDLLRRFVPLEKGVPSHDVFSDVFRMLDPAAFEQAFRGFVAAFAAPTSEARAPCRFTWSTSLRPKPAWRWPPERRPAETSRRRLWKSSKCSA